MEKSSRWAGSRLPNFRLYANRIAMQIVGENVRLTLVCAGARFQVDVALVPPPDKHPRNDTLLSGFNPLSGTKVASLSPVLAEELGLDSAIYGVVVLEVRRGSAAARLGQQISGSPCSPGESLDA